MSFKIRCGLDYLVLWAGIALVACAVLAYWRNPALINQVVDELVRWLTVGTVMLRGG